MRHFADAFTTPRLFCALTLVALLLAAPVRADSGCAAGQPECVAVGSWEFKLAVGAGVRTNPLADSGDIPLVLIPQVSYYGRRFFIDNLDLGFTLHERPGFMLNALVTPNTDGLYFFREDLGRFALDGGLSTEGISAAPPADGGIPSADRDNDAPEHSSDDDPHLDFSPAPPSAVDDAAEPDADEPGDTAQPAPEQNGEAADESDADPEQPDLRSRRLSAMAGLEASGALGLLEWQAQLLHDISGVHNGWAARLAMGTGTRVDSHQIGGSIGLNWQSDRLLDYYYGVSSAEAGDLYPHYRAGGGVTPFARLRWSNDINRQWQWLGSVQYDHLSHAIRRSPIVEDRGVTQAFVGVVYSF